MAPKKSLTLLKSWTGDAAFAAAGSLSAALAQAGLLVVLARLAEPAVVGAYALAVAVATPVALLTRMQLRALLAADVADRYPLSSYLRLRLVSGALTVAVCGALAGAVSAGPGAAAAVVWMAALRAVEGVGDVYYGLLQRVDRWRTVALSQFLRALAVFLAASFGFLFTQRLDGALACAAAGSAAVLLLWDHPAARAAAGRPLLRRAGPRGGVTALAGRALPMGVVAALVSLTVQFPRYALEYFRGGQELGYFAALSQLVLLGNLAVQAFGQAAVARMALAFEHERRRFWTLLAMMLGGAGLAASAGAAVAALWGGPLLALLYGPSYAAHAGVLVWLSVGVGLSYVTSALGYSLTAAGQIAPQMSVHGLAAASCALASLGLVPAYGLYGAASALLVSWLAAAVGSAVILWRSAAQPRGAPGAAPAALL